MQYINKSTIKSKKLNDSILYRKYRTRVDKSIKKMKESNLATDIF